MHKNQDIRALFPPGVCCAAPELILTTWRDAESSVSRETRRKPEEAPVFKKPDSFSSPPDGAPPIHQSSTARQPAPSRRRLSKTQQTPSRSAASFPDPCSGETRTPPPAKMPNLEPASQAAAVEPIRMPTAEEIKGKDIWNNCAVRSVVSGVMGEPHYS